MDSHHSLSSENASSTSESDTTDSYQLHIKTDNFINYAEKPKSITKEQALEKLTTSKQLIAEQKFLEAMNPLHEAKSFFKNLSEKTVEDFILLEECASLSVEVYQHQNLLLLDYNRKLLEAYEIEQVNAEELLHENEKLKEENTRLAGMLLEDRKNDPAIAQAIEELQTFKAANEQLHLQIQALQNRQQPTVLEHIANEIRAKFDSIRQFSYQFSFARSLFTLFPRIFQSAQTEVKPADANQRIWKNL